MSVLGKGAWTLENPSCCCFCDCCDCPGVNPFNDPGKKPQDKKTINESRRLRARIEKEIFRNNKKK